MSLEKAVVPVAGLGTRLMPATISIPKEMLPLGRTPVIERIVEELHESGTHQVLFVTRRGKQSIEDYFDTDTAYGQYSGPDFFYIRQQTPKGLGDAVLTARNFVGSDCFAVANGDSFIFENKPGGLLGSMADVLASRKAAAVIAIEKVPDEKTSRYGIVSPVPGSSGSVMQLQGVVEKPPQGQAPSNFAISARYVFSPVIFDALERTPAAANGEVGLSDAIGQLIKEGHPVYAVLLSPEQKRYDIGNFDSYYKAFVEFALRDEQLGPGLRQYIKELLER